MRTLWQGGGTDRYAISGGRGQAVGNVLVPLILRFEETPIPGGSDPSTITRPPRTIVSHRSEGQGSDP
jgi:hypothetical protein